jgi:hypothetical protein
MLVIRYRWAFLEKGIDNVMVKLEEGVDMKTVCTMGSHSAAEGLLIDAFFP